MCACCRAITVAYAYKKDTKGERHGTPAERLLAEQQRSKAAAGSRPHTMFASGPKQRPSGGLGADSEVRPAAPCPGAGLAAHALHVLHASLPLAPALMACWLHW